MNNEIGRKITSLTLMTIMLAGGMSIAAPSMVPVAHAANANLFVSAENSQFNNYMSGPQVIEVVVIDPSINDTDQGKGEPNVTINGKKLRMVQGVDGNWYGYFADKTMAQRADQTVVGNTPGEGLDFGNFCSRDTNIGKDAIVTVTDTVGIAIGVNATNTKQGIEEMATCTDFVGGDDYQNVIREQKDVNPGTGGTVKVGQIGIDPAVWPFIQLYSLSAGGNVIVKYNKGGGVQTTTLTFDTVDQFASVSLDRAIYPQTSQVHATVTDLWLNIDPTDEDSWTFGANAADATSKGTYYQVFNENGDSDGDAALNGVINISSALGSLMCEDNCRLSVNVNKQNSANNVLTLQNNGDTNLVPGANPNNAFGFTVANTATHGKLGVNSLPVTLTEVGPNSGIFGTYDESDVSVLKITSNAARGTSATIDYNATPRTILVGFSYATVDIQPTDAEWTSGEEIPVIVVDADANKNSRADEDLDLNNPDVQLIPALKTGTPATLRGNGLTVSAPGFAVSDVSVVEVQRFSDRAILTTTGLTTTGGSADQLSLTFGTMKNFFDAAPVNNAKFHGFALLNYDVRSLANEGNLDVSTVDITLPGNVEFEDQPLQGTILIDDTTDGSSDFGALSKELLLTVIFTLNDLDAGETIAAGTQLPVVVDIIGFGFVNDGLEDNERIANQIVRIEAEETGDNTSTFAGSLEFIMLNQLNILDVNTYLDLTLIADDPSFIVIEDLDDEESPRVNYNDLAADGTILPVADQQAAGSHSGVVSLDASSYKFADTVTITLQDLDLNVDSDLVDIYTVVAEDLPSNNLKDVVGNNATSITLSNGEDLGRLLDVTFDDQRWTTPTNECLGKLTPLVGSDTGLAGTGFTLVETGAETGIFIGDFAIPAAWCRSGATVPESVTGLDIEVNYVDFRDASGETIEVGDGAGVRANTGSVSLDRTVYPVPWGIPGDFIEDTTKTTPNGRALFPIHQTGMNTLGSPRSSLPSPDTNGGTQGLDAGEYLGNGDLKVHIRVNDPDFNSSSGGEDFIGQNTTDANPVGLVKVSVIRGSSSVILGYAGGPDVLPGTIDTDKKSLQSVRQFGPMDEIAPDAGIFEADIVLRYTDGPASSVCTDKTSVWTSIDGGVEPAGSEKSRFDHAAVNGDYCILQGDILQVEYTDPADASGDINTVTDSATFDLRNGVLQSDKSVYIIGSDMILTLIEPDFDLDNDQAETYDLDIIEWDSDAATVTMGDADGQGGNFDPEPSNFRETGDSTGIFQIVIEIPQELDGDKLERGEEIVLEYSDWGPSGSDFVGDEDEDVNLTIFTSNFGATVELDQKVYTWTDKVYITIVAPDHNFDSNLVDEIGDTDQDPIKVSTRGNKLPNYKLVETGTDTGIFTGEVILTGFTHNADGDTTTGEAGTGNDVLSTTPSGNGPTDGLLPADDNDGITVSFEFSEDETIVGSALIRWNIGEVQWLEASYPASGTGVVRVIDPDMNLNPEAVDNFSADVWSDSDAGGIDLTVTETNEATGIFEGTVFFTTTDESSGHRLRVAEGDTVTAEYSDNTLPNPYTTADELDITATSLIGTVVPPLERAPAANLRIVDAFGNSLSTVNVDQQVQITADLANGQDREQAFAYLVQIQDGNGVTVSLAWITGSLSAGQSFSPALSWIPTDAGTYTATAFVWESVDNPTALSPPVTTTIIVK